MRNADRQSTTRVLEHPTQTDEIERLAHENAVLAEIGRIISASLHIDEVYGRVAEQVKRLVSFDRIAITYADETKQTFTAAYISGKDVPERRRGHNTILEGSVTGEVINRKRSIAINLDSDGDAAHRYPGLSADIKAGLRSMISVPLISKDDVAGVLHLRSKRPNAYSDYDVAITERIALQIAGAVANSQLHAALEREVCERKTLAEIGKIVSLSSDLETEYERLSNLVRNLIPFDRMAIVSVDADDETYSHLYVDGHEVPPFHKGAELPLEGTSTEEVVRTRSALLTQGEGEEITHGFKGISDGYMAGLRSFLSAPLIANDRVIGVLHIRSMQPHAYTQRHVILAESIGAHLAGAIANAWLFREQSKLQLQLAQAQKMDAIGRLAGIIAHDFNNMLTPIIGFADVALRTLNADNPVRGHVHHIRDAASRSSNLVRQILTFSRQQVVERKVIDLSRVIFEMDGILRRIIGEDMELITRPNPNLWPVKQDQGQMEQVLINLAVNARDAMPHGGRLIIEIDNVTIKEDSVNRPADLPAGNYVVLAVRDNGIGMDDETKAQIFDPFFTTKAVGKGTGIGLATCYGIVTQGGGAIAVESELGQGTTFNIYLPRVHAEIENTSFDDDSPGELRTGTETILLVEDELAVREIAAYVLREQGYTVVEAPNGREAVRTVEELRNADIDLLLTDVVMPGMNGPELANYFTETYPNRGIIFTSGYATDFIAQHGVYENGYAFLPKPFTPDVLTHKVREVLDSKR